MNNFDDFVKTLTSEKMSEISDRAVNYGNDKGSISISNDSTDLVKTINAISILNSLSMVEAYHEWLQQQNQ
ncbi:hypothetical protein ACWOD8_08710 [Enterococcus plantarum]|uniref:hypothetical protein n=1 Tax=Enterococcus plantarum TaxID=1077675 RepID=UPI00114D1B8F|nr:hypothetical protein [Enterococcus plantarum]